MEQWCHSDKFARIFQEFWRGPNSVSDDLIITGFRDTAIRFDPSGEVTNRARDILFTFFQALHESLLRSPHEGLAYHDALDARRRV
jgi:hypothetical protein